MKCKLGYSIALLAGVSMLYGCEKAPTVAPAPVVLAKEQFGISPETAKVIDALKIIGTCTLDTVSTKADGSLNSSGKNSHSVKRGVAYKLSGFATDVEKGVVPKALKMVLVGFQTYGINMAAGVDRPDVATYFKNPALSNAGYQLDIGFDNVAEGVYSVVVLDLDGTESVACPTHQTITVK